MKNTKTKQEILENNYNVIIVIGSTNCGKSSFVKNTFLNDKFILKRDLMPYTTNEDIAIIGNYFTNKRRVGTDTVEREQVGNFAQQIVNLLGNHNKVVLEGMRCVSRPMINKIIGKCNPVLIYVYCDSITLFQRANSSIGNSGNPPTLKHIEGEITMCENFVNYCLDKLDVFKISSKDVTNFNEFKLSNCSIEKLYKDSLW